MLESRDEIYPFFSSISARKPAEQAIDLRKYSIWHDKSGLYTAGTWPRGTPLLQTPAYQGICRQRWVLPRPVHGHEATERSWPNWLCPLSCPQQRLKPHGIHPHWPQLLPELLHFQTYHPNCDADRFHLHDIWITPTLQRTVAPILNVDIRFFVQLTDSGGGYLGTPQSLCNIFYTPNRYFSQVHLNKGFFHTVFPVAVPLNDRSLKELPLILGILRVISPEVVVRFLL